MSEAVPAVEIKNLTKVFPVSFRKENYVVAVDNLSFTVGAGEVYGLIGPNGSGKSTTMKVALGLMAPSSGSTKVFGVDSRDVRARNDIGFLPENPYFYKHLSGVETLKFYGKLCGMGGRELKDRIAELLDMVGLVDAKDRRLGGYSKGMLQRIGLAQALIQRPRLVILDEPTAGVDPVGSREIRDLVIKLKDDGISVFLCSHLLEQVQEVCDEVGIIFEGRMRREGKTRSRKTDIFYGNGRCSTGPAIGRTKLDDFTIANLDDRAGNAHPTDSDENVLFPHRDCFFARDCRKSEPASIRGVSAVDDQKSFLRHDGFVRLAVCDCGDGSTDSPRHRRPDTLHNFIETGASN